MPEGITEAREAQADVGWQILTGESEETYLHIRDEYSCNGCVCNHLLHESRTQGGGTSMSLGNAGQREKS
jgi:hypothetical protein